MHERYAVRADQTAAQLIDGEAVVINFETYHYYGLNRTGTALWRLLETGGREPRELASTLAAAFNRPIAAVAPDVDRLIAVCLKEGLIERTERPGDAAAAPELSGEYIPPSLEKHEKLDQLMLSGE